MMTAAHTNDRKPTALDATLVKPIALTRSANDSPTDASTLVTDVAQVVRQSIIGRVHEMTGQIVKVVHSSVTTSPGIAWCPRSGAPREARRISTRGVV